MANPRGTPKNLRHCGPGQSGNPDGKPVRAHNKLHDEFLQALADTFEKHGKAAIANMRTNDPSGYIRMIASLMPKGLEITGPLDEFSDEQLDAAIVTIRAIIATQGISG